MWQLCCLYRCATTAEIHRYAGLLELILQLAARKALASKPIRGARPNEGVTHHFSGSKGILQQPSSHSNCASIPSVQRARCLGYWHQYAIAAQQQSRRGDMADDASDGEVEDDADWRARVRRLRPFLLDADLVPPSPNPPDTSSSCFASWTRLHAKAPEPPGGFASDAGAKALDALLRDRRQAAPGAFARQCAALGGLDARRSHVLFEGELDIPAEDYYDTARALQNARWSRQRAGRAEDDLTHGRWADAVRRFGDAIALDATNGDAYRGRARARVGLCLLYTSPSPRDGLLSRMPSSA